jgi:hypothetical protein
MLRRELKNIFHVNCRIMTIYCTEQSRMERPYSRRCFVMKGRISCEAVEGLISGLIQPSDVMGTCSNYNDFS